MSSVCLESTTSKEYYVSLTVEVRYGNNVYVVQVCPIQGNDTCGYPIKEMPYIEERKARAAYKRYVKK